MKKIIGNITANNLTHLATLVTLLSLLLFSHTGYSQDPFNANAANSSNNTTPSFIDDNVSTDLNDTGIDEEFLLVDEAYILNLDYQQAKQLRLDWQIADKYYLYRHAFKFEISKEGSDIDFISKIPTGLAKVDEYFGAVEVYYGGITVELNQLPTSGTYTLKVTSQGCADAGLCYPPRHFYFHVDADTLSINEIEKPKANTSKSASDGQATTNPIIPDQGADGLPYMLLLALIGGAILNLMPCVFPILSLKVLAFANDKKHAQSLHGISYTIGVVMSFIVVAAILISLRAAGEAIGWGFHLQSPTFVALLAYLFFVMGLGLSGAIEMGTSWMNVGGKLASKSGYTGSFFTGILATVVASPCTAPFMGTALGFAIAQSNLVALSVFAALGLGMALPVLCLSFSNKLLAKIPKPGPWMDQLKQLLAFPLYATTVWLCWVIGNQVGVNGMAIILVGCTLIALAIWLWPQGTWWKRSIAALVAALALSIPSGSLLDTNDNTASNSIPYSPDTLAQLRQQGQPVFINITADWCITCLANEKISLGTSAVKQTLSELGYTYLKGDWTNYDPTITKLLEQYGRSGIPFYIVYPGDNSSEGRILPQILTKDIVIDALHEAANR